MDTNLNRAVGVELKAMRDEANMTQDAIAKKLGKPQSYVSKLESGERSLRLPEISDYADALNIQLGDFMLRVDVCIKDYRRLKTSTQPFNIHFKCSDVCYFIKTPVGAFFKNLKCMLFPDPTAHTR